MEKITDLFCSIFYPRESIINQIEKKGGEKGAKNKRKKMRRKKIPDVCWAGL